MVLHSCRSAAWVFIRKPCKSAANSAAPSSLTEGMSLHRRQAEADAAAAAAVPADEPLRDRLQRLALRAFVKVRTYSRMSASRST